MSAAVRPFRFGVQARGARKRSDWVELARRCEGLGYDVLTMPDHFDDQLAPVPALMCAADATSTLRVGALVWDNDYKHPVVLAKELATLDVLSEGRLEIGIGAGWMVSDYRQSGIVYDPPKVRLDRFEEALEVIRRSMTAEPFSFEGQHYRIDHYRNTPAPVQAPCPPILIGGGGDRVLGIAARQADIVGINATMHSGVIGPDTFTTMTAEAVDAKVATVRAAAGARLADIEFNIRAFLVNITADRSAGLTTMSTMLGVSPSMVEQTPFALIGPPAAIVDDLLARRERWGFSYVIVGDNDVDAFAPVVDALAGR